MLEELQARGHEQVSFVQHAPSGLRAVIALHSTVLGPAIAGCRLMAYEEERATRHALALSESLTLKAALAGLNLGGGACVLLAPEDLGAPHAREALFRALGREVRLFGGRLLLTEDVGVDGADLAYAAQETRFTLGMHTDTPAVTAYGVYRGMKAAARFLLGGESLRGVRVAILGAGSVGRALGAHLRREGAKLTVADARPEKAVALAEEQGDAISVVDADAIFDVPCDIFAPCAYGHSLRSAVVPRLQAKLIAGGEHNPLSENGRRLLAEAGIVYVPDFAINAAGLIAAATALNPEEAAERVYQNVSRVCEEAQRSGASLYGVARASALTRIALIASLGNLGVGQTA